MASEQEIEAAARRIAARKCGMAYANAGKLPDELWRQAIPAAEAALFRPSEQQPAPDTPEALRREMAESIREWTALQGPVVEHKASWLADWLCSSQHGPVGKRIAALQADVARLTEERDRINAKLGELNTIVRESLPPVEDVLVDAEKWKNEAVAGRARITELEAENARLLKAMTEA